MSLCFLGCQINNWAFLSHMSVQKLAMTAIVLSTQVHFQLAGFPERFGLVSFYKAYNA
jgi:hypothetical protein